MIQHVCYSRSKVSTKPSQQYIPIYTAYAWQYSPPTSPHIIRKQPVWTKVDQWEKEDKKQNSKSVLALYPNIHILDSCPIIFITISYLREFDKRSLKHFPSGDPLISFHNLSPPLSNEIVWRKFKLVISGLNGLKWKLCICTPKHFITTYL